MPTITNTNIGIIKEKLIKPFAFKGSTLTELWHIVSQITLSDGTKGIGVGVQSVLWSDAVCFAAYSEDESNKKMLDITQKALKMLEGMQFTNPQQLIDDIFLELLKYANRQQNRKDVSETFVLNALVGVDFALWQIWNNLYSNGTFSALTKEFAPILKQHSKVLGNIPLITYSTSEDEIKTLLNDGTFLLKIKIGSNPYNNSDVKEMLNWDIQRLKQIHNISKNYKTPYTQNEKVLYYLDANARYPNKDTLLYFLDQANKIQALDNIIIFEEPLNEQNLCDLSDLPVNFAADESIHNLQNLNDAIELYGFKAIALKPIAKTLSLTLKMINIALEKNISCFCADLTVPPVLLNWNMSVAASLPHINGLNTGIVESNGIQNYVNWQAQEEKCPTPNANFRKLNGGVYNIGDDFLNKEILFKYLTHYSQ